MNDNVVAQALGDLQGTVRSMADQWKEQERSATAGRHALRDKVDALISQQSTLAAKVEQQAEKLAEVEPAIKRFEQDRQRREGANSMAKVIWAGVIAFATGLGYVGHELMLLFWPPKGH